MIFLWVYLAGCAAALVPISRWFLRDFGGNDPDSADIAFAVGIGVCITWVWPLIVLAYPVYRVLKNEVRQEEAQ